SSSRAGAGTAHEGEEVVTEPQVALEHPAKEEPGARRRDRHGQEHHGADKAAKRDAGVEEERDRHAYDQLDADGGRSEARGHAERVPERVVVPDVAEVVEPDERLPGNREVVVVEAQLEAVEERVEEDNR